MTKRRDARQNTDKKEQDETIIIRIEQDLLALDNAIQQKKKTRTLVQNFSGFFRQDVLKDFEYVSLVIHAKLKDKLVIQRFEEQLLYKSLYHIQQLDKNNQVTAQNEFSYQQFMLALAWMRLLRNEFRDDNPSFDRCQLAWFNLGTALTGMSKQFTYDVSATHYIGLIQAQLASLGSFLDLLNRIKNPASLKVAQEKFVFNIIQIGELILNDLNVGLMSFTKIKETNAQIQEDIQCLKTNEPINLVIDIHQVAPPQRISDIVVKEGKREIDPPPPISMENNHNGTPFKETLSNHDYAVVVPTTITTSNEAPGQRNMTASRETQDQASIEPVETSAKVDAFAFNDEFQKLLKFFDPKLTKNQLESEGIKFASIDSSKFSLVEPKLEKQANESVREYIGRLKAYITQLQTLASHIDDLYPRVSIYQFNGKVGKNYYSDARDCHPKIYDKIKEEIQEIEHVVHLKQQALGEKLREAFAAAILPEANTIKVRIWHTDAPGEGPTRLGIPTGGHLSIDICPNDKTQRQYISLVPKPKAKILREANPVYNSLTRLLHTPSAADREGIFLTPEEDVAHYLMADEKGHHHYHRYEEVVIRVDDAHMQAARQWAGELRKNYDNESKLYTYNFYHANCSTIVLEGLKQAGCEQVAAFDQPLSGIIYPQQVFDHARLLACETQCKMLEENIRKGTVYHTDKDRLLAMIDLTINQLRACQMTLSLERMRTMPSVAPDVKDAKLEVEPQDERLDELEKMIERLEAKRGEIDKQEVMSQTVVSEMRTQLHKDMESLEKSQLPDAQAVVKKLYNFTHMSGVLLHMVPKLFGNYVEAVVRLQDQKYADLKSELAATQEKLKAINGGNDHNKMYQMSQHLAGLIDWHQKQIATCKLVIRQRKGRWLKSTAENLKVIKLHQTQLEICETSLADLQFLRSLIGEMNACLLFNQNAANPYDLQNHFKPLQQCFSKTNSDDATLDALITTQMGALNVKPASVSGIARFFKTKAAKDAMFAETQLALHQVLQNSKLSFMQKESRMRHIIAEAKGNDTRLFGTSARYVQLAFEARLLCYLQGFQQGEIPVMKMVVLLDVLKQQVPESHRESLQQLVDGLKKMVIALDTKPFASQIQKSLKQYADSAAQDPAKEASLPREIRNILNPPVSASSVKQNGLFKSPVANEVPAQQPPVEVQQPELDVLQVNVEQPAVEVQQPNVMKKLNEDLFKVKQAVISRTKAYRKW